MSTVWVAVESPTNGSYPLESGNGSHGSCSGDDTTRGSNAPFFLIFVTGNRFYLHPSTPGVTRNLVIIIRNNLVIIRIVNDD